MMYHYVASRLDEAGRLKFDALLGDADAQAELDKARHGTAVAAGFEVG